MVFPSLPPQDYELYPGPPYSTRWVADLACADDAIETTGRRQVSLPNHDLAESCVAVSAGVCDGRPRKPSSAPDQPAGSFAAKTSTISILGVSANNRGASAIRVRAMSPARCAWRAASPANASNIANVAGPMRSANQTGVVVSRFASATALSRNPFTSSSLPGFACKRTNSATLTICPRFPEVADMPSHPRQGPRAGCTNAPDSRLPT